MYYQTKSVVYSRAFMDKVLTALKTNPAAALIAALTVRLMHGPLPALTPDTTLATLVALETNFSGYAAATPTPTVPVQMNVNVDGYIANATFVAATASPFVGDTISGYFVTDGTNLVAAEAFAAGFVAPLVAVGDFLSLDLALPGNLLQDAS